MIQLVLAAMGSLGFIGLGFTTITNRFSSPGSSRGAAEILDGLGIAVPGILLVSLAAIRADIFDRPVLIVVGIVAIISIDPRSARSSLPSPMWLGLIGIITAAGLWLRRDPVYFLGDWTDFGEYVNRGNSIADGGPPGGFFPPLTETYIALGHLLFSQRYALVIVPVLAVITGLFVAGVSGVLTGSRAAAVLAGSLFAIHPVAVWFGRLPTSEVGFGLLASILAYQLIRAGDGERSWPIGLTVAAMVVSRPNGLVLVLPFTAIVVVAALSDARWDPWARTVGPFVVGWISGFLWLANFGLFRGFAATLGGLFGVETATLNGQLSNPGWQAAVVIGMLLYWVVLSRIWTAPTTTISQLVRVLIGTTVLATFGVVALAGRLFLLRDGLSSIGYPTLVLALVGGLALMIERETSLAGLAAVLAPATLWSMVYAFQLDEILPHYVFLYWERFLFPNVTLAIFVLAGGLAAAVERMLSSSAARTGAVYAALIPPLILARLFVPQYELQHHKQYHGAGFYDALEAIADDIPEGAAVAYNGVPSELIWDRYFFFFPTPFGSLATPSGSPSESSSRTSRPCPPRPTPWVEPTQTPHICCRCPSNLGIS